MSRKDVRRMIRVPLSAREIAYLRRLARGRSLADALRRVIETAADPARLPGAEPQGARLLPLQLPKAARACIARAAQESGRSEQDVIRAALVHHMTQPHNAATGP